MAGEIVFRPTLADYVAVARTMFWRGLARRRFLIRIVIVLLIGAAAGPVFVWITDGTVDVRATGFAVAAMIGWLVLVLGLSFLLVPRRAGRLFRQQRTLDQDFRVTWDEAGYTQQWEHGAVLTRWADYHDWFENDRILAFGINEQLFHFAPKRVMTAEQIADLRTMAMRIGG